MYSKDNKKVLEKSAKQEKQTVIKSENKKAGRPSKKDKKGLLSIKYTININSYESEFLENLVKETGVPVSTYLRKKLLEVKAFGN